jgi:hypothetical protein
MRKIQKILAGEGLPGEYGPLVDCVSPGAVSNWRTALKVMDAIQISEKKFKHVQHSHAEEIGRRVKDPGQWGHWVKKCEKEKWTVVQLRHHLQGNGDGPKIDRNGKDYITSLNQCLKAIQRALATPKRLVTLAKVIHPLHDDLRDLLRQVEDALAQEDAA